MNLISGLIFGILFGYLLKRSRFCATGITRDILLEKKYSNFIYIPVIIFTQAFIYHLMIATNLIPASKADNFSLLEVLIGSLMFGFGAVICNGCITSSLVKFGDGRIIGVLSIIVYTLSAYTAKEGFLLPIHENLKSIAPVKAHFIAQFNPYIVSLISFIVALILYIALFKLYRKNKLDFEIPGRFTGLRHILFEKIWSKELVVILIGILMGLGFLFSNLSGRNGGFGITTPLISWFKFLAFGSKIGWASTFVLGIIVGVFVTTLIGAEFSIVLPKPRIILPTILGSMLMGIGAVWAQGCFVGNVMVGTSQFSVKAWYSLIFIYIGVWIATKFILMRNKR